MVAQDQSHWNMMAFLFQIILIFHQLGDACAQDSICEQSKNYDNYCCIIKSYNNINKLNVIINVASSTVLMPLGMFHRCQIPQTNLGTKNMGALALE